MLPRSFTSRVPPSGPAGLNAQHAAADLERRRRGVDRQRLAGLARERCAGGRRRGGGGRLQPPQQGEHRDDHGAMGAARVPAYAEKPRHRVSARPFAHAMLRWSPEPTSLPHGRPSPAVRQSRPALEGGPQGAARSAAEAGPPGVAAGWRWPPCSCWSAAPPALAFPGGMRKVIDGALNGARHADGWTASPCGMALISLIFGVSIALRAYLFNTAGERVVTRLRETLYRRILDQEVAFFDARRTGELTSRLASDTGVLQNAVSANVSMVLRSLRPGRRAGWCCCSITSPLLTALMLSVVPAVAMGAVIYGRRVRRLARDVQDALAAAGRDRRGEHRRPAHRALVRRRGEGGRPLRRRRGQGVRAGPQADRWPAAPSWPSASFASYIVGGAGVLVRRPAGGPGRDDRRAR